MDPPVSAKLATACTCQTLSVALAPGEAYRRQLLPPARPWNSSPCVDLSRPPLRSSSNMLDGVRFSCDIAGLAPPSPNLLSPPPPAASTIQQSINREHMNGNLQRKCNTNATQFQCSPLLCRGIGGSRWSVPTSRMWQLARACRAGHEATRASRSQCPWLPAARPPVVRHASSRLRRSPRSCAPPPGATLASPVASVAARSHAALWPCLQPPST